MDKHLMERNGEIIHPKRSWMNRGRSFLLSQCPLPLGFSMSAMYDRENGVSG